MIVDASAALAVLLWLPGTLIFAYLSAWLLRGTSTSHYAWGVLMLAALALFALSRKRNRAKNRNGEGSYSCRR